MADLTIITNNVPRLIVNAYELPIEVRDDFNYIDWTAIEMGHENHDFVQYKGEWYHLGDTMSTHGMTEFREAGWDGYVSDSFFSGILIKYCSDMDHVIMGRYYC